MLINCNDELARVLIKLGVAVDAAPVLKPKTKPVVDVVKNSPNFSERSQKIDTVVLHNTDGDYEPSVRTLMSPDAQVSAHLVIGRDGKTTQLVPFEKKAWHAVQANSRSIGIELVAWNKEKGMTSQQEATLVSWLKWLMQEYGIKVEAVIAHREVVSTDCPGWIWPTGADLDKWKKEHL
jgi:N-acetylmuramoyl-L-alanine amidase